MAPSFKFTLAVWLIIYGLGTITMHHGVNTHNNYRSVSAVKIDTTGKRKLNLLH
jgi:hypothetical protein